MSLSHPLPWFAICAVCLLIGWVIARSSAFYGRELDASGGRFQCVDGLRGFLALGVFAVHAVNMYTLHAEGRWSTGIAPFHSRAAVGGVALFFMITGFLFWLRVLRSGREFDVVAFLAARVRRLTPMYLASVVMALAVIAAGSAFMLQVSPGTLARELRPWLSFGFMDTGTVNGVEEARYVNAVYWTLAYEWMFYLALPLVALFARGWGALALVLAVIVFGTQKPIVFNFLCGAAAAWLVHARWLEGRLHSPWLTALPLASLGAFFALPAGYGLAQSLALFGFFVFVVHGASLFGLLRTRAARVLGTISYSIYLTHCIVLFVVVGVADRVVPMRELGAGAYWTLAGAAAAACVLLSAFTYRHVEHPFLHPQPSRKPARAPAEALS